MMNHDLEPTQFTARRFDTQPFATLNRADRWRQFFLGRLTYLLEMRNGLAGTLKPQDERLLNWAFYSTYRDCVSVGAGDEARALLGLSNSPATPPVITH